jgi:PAS domain S-box-containing protein
MKQDKKPVDFFNQQSEWVAQFDNMTVLAKLLDLCESLAIYIVDKNQQILYWNRGAEQLSGLGCKKVIGKPCLLEYVITDKNDNK